MDAKNCDLEAPVNTGLEQHLETTDISERQVYSFFLPSAQKEERYSHCTDIGEVPCLVFVKTCDHFDVDIGQK